MKNSNAYLLLAVSCVLMALMAGFFLGRNTAHSPVILSGLPSQIQVQGRLDINAATAEQLQQLPGIGQTLAQRIIDYRDAHGPFEKLADLTLVEGVGIAILEQIIDYAVVQEDTQ